MHPRDLLGKYVQYRVDPGSTSAAGQMVNGLLSGKATAAMVTVYEGPSANAVHAKGQWNFTFLKYCAGAVTFTSLTGGPVLTGPMSGCYLCTYNRLGLKLAHIGTAHSPTSPDSVKAKKDWLMFVGRPDVSNVMGCKPDDYFSVGDIKAAMFAGGDIPVVVGYFVSGEAHAMLLAPVPTKENPLRLTRIAAYKRITMQPWSAIAAMRTFRL
jgi:hypothetical protein